MEVNNALERALQYIQWLLSEVKNAHHLWLGYKSLRIVCVMNMEEWKQIPGFEGYEASTFGNIRNRSTQKVLKPHHVQDAYSQVRLSLGSRANFKLCRVHRLVALAWIPNDENKATVNHINRNKHDNALKNLEWASHREQAVHCASYERVGSRCKYAEQFHIEDEIWRPIPSCTEYQVSTHGRIKNKNSMILKGHDKSRYIQMRIVDKKHVYAHRAVAEAFLDNYSSECVVNHKDGNRHNNNVDNLECITQSQNILHAYNTNLLKRRIPISQYTIDGDLKRTYESFLDAARQTGMKEGSIRWSIKYNNGVHGGYVWKITNEQVLGTSCQTILPLQKEKSVFFKDSLKNKR
jgi:hypothetical protein